MNETRWMALDYGTKRCGLAVTDPLRIIASPLETIDTPKLWGFLERYLVLEKVSRLIVGLPMHADGTPTRLEDDIRGFLRKFKKKWPDIQIIRVDEQMSSVRAQEIIRNSGARKMKRRDKSLLDKISASILLQEYMESKGPSLNSY